MTVIGRACSMLGEPVPAWLRQVTCHSRDAPLASNSARRDFACCLSRWHAPTKRAGRTAPGTPRGRRARPSVHGLPAPGSRHSPALRHPRAPHRRGLRRGRRGAAALRPLPAAAVSDGPTPAWCSCTAAAGCAATRARRPATRCTSRGEGIATVSISYRLAPAHRFPAPARRRAPRAALGARARGASSGIDPERLALLGAVRRRAPGDARASRARPGGARAGPARRAARRVRRRARRDRALRSVRPRAGSRSDMVDAAAGRARRAIPSGSRLASPLAHAARRDGADPPDPRHRATSVVSWRESERMHDGAASTPGRRASCCCSTARRTRSRSTGAARRTSARTSRWTPSSIASWREAAAERREAGPLPRDRAPSSRAPSASSRAASTAISRRACWCRARIRTSSRAARARASGTSTATSTSTSMCSLRSRSCSATTIPRSTRRRARAGRGRAAASTARARVWVELAERLVVAHAVGRVGGLREERLRRLHLGDAGRARGDGQARRSWPPKGAYHGTHAWCAPHARRHHARGPRARRALPLERPRRASTRALDAHDGDVAGDHRDARSATTPSTTRRCRRPGFLEGLRAALRPPRRRARSSTTCAPASGSILAGSGDAVGVAARPHLLLQGARQRLPDLRRARPRGAARAAERGLLHRLVLDGPGRDGGRARVPRRARGERRHRAHARARHAAARRHRAARAPPHGLAVRY